MDYGWMPISLQSKMAVHISSGLRVGQTQGDGPAGCDETSLVYLQVGSLCVRLGPVLSQTALVVSLQQLPALLQHRCLPLLRQLGTFARSQQRQFNFIGQSLPTRPCILVISNCHRLVSQDTISLLCGLLLLLTVPTITLQLRSISPRIDLLFLTRSRSGKVIAIHLLRPGTIEVIEVWMWLKIGRLVKESVERQHEINIGRRECCYGYRYKRTYQESGLALSRLVSQKAAIY